jgi:hypothetical protein
MLAIVVVLICLAGPVTEMFDSWDSTQKSGDDTEASAVAIAMCVGGAILTAQAFVTRLGLFFSSRGARTQFVESRCVEADPISFFGTPEVAHSPPVSLRI